LPVAPRIARRNDSPPRNEVHILRWWAAPKRRYPFLCSSLRYTALVIAPNSVKAVLGSSSLQIAHARLVSGAFCASYRSRSGEVSETGRQSTPMSEARRQD